MSGIKIGPPGGPPRVPAAGAGEGRVDGPKGARFADAVSGAAAAAPAEGAQGLEPAEIVQRVRRGEIDVDRAVDLLIDRAFGGGALARAPEALRQEVRQAITELAREDPTLAALVRAIER